METINMGKSGLQISQVGLGCNNFGATIDLEKSRKVLHGALDLGITLLDTSDNYGMVWGDTETVMGEALKGIRDKFIIGTKFGVPMPGKRDASRWWINRAVERSLQRLQTDYLDLYLLHWPDPKTPMDETLRAMDDLVRSGKVRYIGLSNHSAWQVVEATWLAKEMNVNSFILAQNEYHLLNRKAEAELIPALSKYGMALQPYFPLAGGLLTGKYNAGGQGRLVDNWANLKSYFMTESNLEIVASLDAYAKARGHTMLELAMSWLACQPTTGGIICGATRVEQLEQNVKACSWKMTTEELSEINVIAD